MNNKNNIMSIISKKISIDNRNKIITKPFVFENKTFEKFNSQYSIYKNEIRFIDCIFQENVVWGTESTDEAHSIIESDLIFKNCIFKQGIYLDGVQCNGHIIFDHCSFDSYISISNANINIGIAFIQCVISGDVNICSTNIQVVGCQFIDSSITHGNLNLSKSNFARELSIKGCSIKCNFVNFDYITLFDKQGSFQIGGGAYQQFVSTQEIADFLLTEYYHVKELETFNFVNFYELINEEGTVLLIEKNNIEYDEAFCSKVTAYMLSVCKEHIINKKYIECRYADYDELDPAYPCGNGLISISGDGIYIVLYMDGYFYHTQVKENNEIIKCDESNYAKIIFKQELNNYLNNYNDSNFNYELCYYNNVRMIKMLTNRNDIYISIYDSNQGFKVYKWNCIEASVININNAFVGQDLFFKQSEINTPKLILKNLSAEKTIEFEDCKLYCDIDARNINTNDLKFNNIDFERPRIDFCDTSFFINPEYGTESENDINMINGIDLSYSIIKNRFVLNDICISSNHEESALDNSEKVGFDVFLKFSKIGSLFEFNNIGKRQSHNYVLNLYLSNANLNQIVNQRVRWERVNLKIEYSSIQNFKSLSKENKSELNFNHIYKISQSIKSESEKIIFLKQMESSFIKEDKYDDFEKTWKFRNKIRIKKKWGYISFIPLMWNSLVVNYGLSTWRLAMWLIVIMTAFDFLVYFRFEKNVSFCIVNGCVEFMPVSFNTPIMDQLRPHDIAERLKTFEYSSLVTAYKVISYVLVSVLIASFSGFFRSRNE